MIAFVANKFNAPNGADLIAGDILRGILGSGLPLAVVSSDPPADWNDLALHNPSLRLVQPPLRMRETRLSRGVLGNLFLRLWSRLSAPSNARLIRQNSSDGIIVNGFGNHWVFRFLKPETASPRALIMHDSPLRFTFKGQPSMDWALQRMRGYTHFIFCSRKVANEWAAAGALRHKDYCVIHNCCREAEVHRIVAEERLAVRKRLGLPLDSFLVVCPASIQRRKGQDLLVDSLPQLRRSVRNCSICLVGAPLDGWGEALVQLIKASGSMREINLCGLRQNALEFIYAADAMVLPSRSEVAPLVILEAMALGTPVVAACVGGVPELIENGRSGLLFPAEDREQMVRALASLAEGVVGRSAVSKAALHRYWSLFSRDRLVQSYSEAVRRMSAGKPWRVSNAKVDELGRRIAA